MPTSPGPRCDVTSKKRMRSSSAAEIASPTSPDASVVSVRGVYLRVKTVAAAREARGAHGETAGMHVVAVEARAGDFGAALQRSRELVQPAVVERERVDVECHHVLGAREQEAGIERDLVPDVHREPHEPHTRVPPNDLARVVARRIVDDDDLRPVRASTSDEIKQDGQVAGRIPVDRDDRRPTGGERPKPLARAAAQSRDQRRPEHAPEHVGGESGRME